METVGITDNSAIAMVEKANMEIEKVEVSRIEEIDFNNIPFGKIFSDHMFVADYSDGEWKDIKK